MACCRHPAHLLLTLAAGIDAVGESGHPNWPPGETDRRWAYRGQPRAAGGAWDLGADEQ